MAKQKKLRIGFDASPVLLNRTGVAYYIERLTEQMAKHDPDIELVGFYFNFLGRHDTSHLPTAPNIRYRPIRFMPSKIINQLRRWGVNPPLELFVRERLDFVIFGNFWGYPSIRRIPSAPVIHDLTFIDLPEYVAEKNRKDLIKQVPKQIKRSEFAITVSEFSKKRIVEEYDVKPNNVLVTPIPPPPPVHHSKPEKQKTLKKLGITKPFILFLGTVEPRKNIISLIDAYEQLPEKLRAEYSLVIVGRIGWNCEKELERLERAKRQKLDVIQVGYTSDHDKEVIYGSASLFVSASRYEGFGMPVLEAMSYGVPCTLSDISVFREVAGEAALYFNPSDPGSIEGSVSKILTEKTISDKLADMGEKQSQKYSWEQIGSSVINMINKYT